MKKIINASSANKTKASIISNRYDCSGFHTSTHSSQLISKTASRVLAGQPREQRGETIAAELYSFTNFIAHFVGSHLPNL